LSVALWPILALLFAFVLAAVIDHEYRWFDRVWSESYAELPSFRRATDLKAQAVPFAPVDDTVPSQSALETHIAGYFPKVVEDGAFWKRGEVQAVFWPGPEKAREELRQVIAKRGAVTPEELRNADKQLSHAFARWQREDRKAARTAAYVCFTGALGLGVLVSLVWTLCSGTPLGMRISGLSLVRWRDGRPAARLRAAARVLVAWVPAFGALAFLGVAPEFDAGPALMAFALGLNLLVFAAALLMAVRLPERGLADRICGTAIVPR